MNSSSVCGAKEKRKACADRRTGSEGESKLLAHAEAAASVHAPVFFTETRKSAPLSPSSFRGG